MNNQSKYLTSIIFEHKAFDHLNEIYIYIYIYIIYFYHSFVHSFISLVEISYCVIQYRLLIEKVNIFYTH